jgi:hypothetical protein
MSIVSRGLPAQPHLDIPKRQARELLAQAHVGESAAIERVRTRHPKFQDAGAASSALAGLRLADAQLVIAREYGFANWPEMKRRIEGNDAARALLHAIHAGDRPAAVSLLRAQPALLHLPLRSGNWGPPMSHAANLGRLEIVQAIAALGARDFQHAFDRAVLQGQIACARWLHTQGATLVPGIVMGACETLNVEGFRFLLELGAPLTDRRGDRLAPLALVLETYGRHPEGKHALLGLLAQHGYALPDTPAMALHRGDLARLRAHLRADPGLLERRFTRREIYPAACGCGDDGRSGMHWTPIEGATLLHLAIDFREREIFDWLLAADADVEARAATDDEGFGGHTPLFHAVVNGPGDDDAMTRALLARGASPAARASLRKFLDWCDAPRWHVARDVTPLAWARGFPEPNWVNESALRLLEPA